MRESKRSEEAKREQQVLSSGYADLCEVEDEKGAEHENSLRVQLILPENKSKQAQNTCTSKEITTLPTLPSICEFTMFTARNRSSAKTTENQISQGRAFTKLPPMGSNLKTVKMDGAANGLAANNKASTNKGPVACTKQNIQMEVKCKLPEDYKDPTYRDTKKRIWDWLRQSEEHQPTYLRRANAFKNALSLDNRTDSQYKTFSQRRTVTQRIGL